MVDPSAGGLQEFPQLFARKIHAESLRDRDGGVAVGKRSICAGSDASFTRQSVKNFFRVPSVFLCSFKLICVMLIPVKVSLGCCWLALALYHIQKAFAFIF